MFGAEVKEQILIEEGGGFIGVHVGRYVHSTYAEADTDGIAGWGNHSERDVSRVRGLVDGGRRRAEEERL